MLSFYQAARCARLTQLFLGGEHALAGLPDPDAVEVQETDTGADDASTRSPRIPLSQTA
jgi:hypothetical protein